MRWRGTKTKTIRAIVGGGEAVSLSELWISRYVSQDVLGGGMGVSYRPLHCDPLPYLTVNCIVAFAKSFLSLVSCLSPEMGEVGLLSLGSPDPGASFETDCCRPGPRTLVLQI